MQKRTKLDQSSKYRQELRRNWERAFAGQEFLHHFHEFLGVNRIWNRRPLRETRQADGNKYLQHHRFGDEVLRLDQVFGSDNHLS